MSILNRYKPVLAQPDDGLGTFDEFELVVSVSKDGNRHTLETEGAVRLYANDMIVFARGASGVMTDMLIRIPFTARKYPEQMRFHYSDIVRAYFPKKRTFRIDLADGRYVFFILNVFNLDNFINLIRAHGINYEPYAG